MLRFPTADRRTLASSHTSARITEGDPLSPDGEVHLRFHAGGIHLLANLQVTRHPACRAHYRGVDVVVAKARATSEIVGTREPVGNDHIVPMPLVAGFQVCGRARTNAENQSLSPAIRRLERTISSLLAGSASALAVIDALDETTGDYRIVLTGRLDAKTRNSQDAPDHDDTSTRNRFLA